MKFQYESYLNTNELLYSYITVVLYCYALYEYLSNHEQTYEFLILISSHYQISVRILSNHEQVLSCNLSVCLILMMLYDVLSNNE